jgi:hypothetical protein
MTGAAAHLYREASRQPTMQLGVTCKMTSEGKRAGRSRTRKRARLGLLLGVMLALVALAALRQVGLLPALAGAVMVAILMYAIEFWDSWRHPPRDP